MGEMIKTTLKLCKTCKYSYCYNENYLVTCDYLLITGNLRGCEVGECDKYEPGKIRRNPFTFSASKNKRRKIWKKF